MPHNVSKAVTMPYEALAGVSSKATLPYESLNTVRVGTAFEIDTALPIRAIKAAVTPPPQEATSAERRQWIEERALILASACFGWAIGAEFKGPFGGVVGSLLAGTYAAIEITRRG